MKRVDRLLAEVLRNTRVVHPALEAAVTETARTYWPSLQPEEVRVGDFRQGVLHVVLNSHARMAEAKGFLGEDFRERLNQYLQAPEVGSPGLGSPGLGSPGLRSPGLRSHGGRGRGGPRRGGPGLYVAKLHFHVRGTF